MIVAPAFLQAQSYNWGNVTIGGGGFVSAIVTSPSEEGLLYARTDVGGAYRWDAANEKWIPLLDWVGEDQVGYLGVESLAIDPREPNKLYMLVGISYFNSGRTAILRSDDYGQTFSITDVTSQFMAHGNGMGRQNGEKLVVDANKPNILFTGTRWNGLFKSSDSGENWSRVEALDITTTPNENGISFVLLDSLSSPQGTPSQTIFVGVSRTGTNLYRSDNGGESFSPVSGGPTDLMPQRAVLAGDGNLYITYANGAGPHPHWAVPEPMDAGRLMKYNTKTGEWINVTPFGNNRPYGGISVDPENPQRIITSTINTWLSQNGAYGDRFFMSTNGGASWTDIVARGFELDDNGYEWINGQSIHWAGSIEFDPFNTQKVWVTSGNGVYSTENVDATPAVWEFTVQNLEETVPLDLVSIPGGPVVSVIGDYDGFVHHDVDEPGIIHRPGMGTTTGLAYAAQNPDVLLRYGDKLFYSLNRGETWTETTSKGDKGQVAISADGEAFLHSPDGSSTTYRSTDRGASWVQVNGLSISSTRPVADPVNSNTFYAYNPANGAMYVSKDKGAYFSAAGSTGRGGSKIIRTVPGKEGHLWVALNNGGLARSTDSGKTFIQIGKVGSAAAVGIGKAAPGSAYPTVFIWGTVDGVRGLYRSVDEGQSWARINDDAHEFGGPGNGQFVIGDMNVFGRVYMSTAGRGIVYGTPNCVSSPIQGYMQIEGEEKQSVHNLKVDEGVTVILSPESSEGGSWFWIGPKGFTSESREIKIEDITGDLAGVYSVNYTNPGGCTSPTQKFTIEVNAVTGIKYKSYPGKIKVFPNPSNGHMTVEVAESHWEELLLIDYSGRIVVRQKITSSGSPISLKTEIPKGVYLLQVKGTREITSSRIMIK